MKLTQKRVAELNDQTAPNSAKLGVVKIVAVSLDDASLLDSDGKNWPIIHTFDWMGEETDDPDEVVSGVATDVTGTKFLAFDFGEFEPTTVH